MTTATKTAGQVNPWRRRLYIVGVGLGLLLFAWQLVTAVANLRARQVSWVAPGWLAVALGAAVAGYLLQLGGWLLVMRYLRCDLTWRDTYAGYFLSFLPRYIPGTVWGYLGRSEWLARAHAVDYRRSSAGSLLEAGSFVATALAIGALAYLPAAWRLPACLLLVAGAVGAWLLLARWPAAIPGGGRWTLIAPAYGVYVVYWCVQGVGLAAICRSLGIGAGVNLLHLTAASAAGWSAGFLVLFVPAGFGVRELSLTYLLTAQAGMAAPDANLVAVLSRLGMIVAEALMLATALLLRRRGAAQEGPDAPGLWAPDARNE